MTQHTMEQRAPTTGNANDAPENGNDSAASHAPDHQAIKEHAEERLAETRDHLCDSLNRSADSVRERIAGELEIMGEAAHAATEQLNENDHERVGTYTEALRNGCNKAARYIADNDNARIGEDARGVAKSHPALFVGGIALAGFVLGRVLTAKPAPAKSEGSTGSTGNQNNSSYGGVHSAAAGTPGRFPEAKPNSVRTAPPPAMSADPAPRKPITPAKGGPVSGTGGTSPHLSLDPTV